VRLDWTPLSALALSYANFVGREPHATTGDHDLRVFHDFVARVTPSARTLLVGTFDVGTQDGDTWYAGSLVGRWWATPALGINGRVERFDDEGGVIVPGLRTWGASLGVDVARGPALWRTEARTFFGAEEEIFPDRDSESGLSKTSTAVVTSLSVRI
jgi:putative OmpL-like beta-barrel porin-2